MFFLPHAAQHLALRWGLLPEEEKQTGGLEVAEEEQKMYCMRPRREDVLNHGCAEGCQGCQTALSGTCRQSHSEMCLTSMEQAVKLSVEGQIRVARQVEKENKKLALKLEESETRASKKGGRDEE